MKAIVAVLNRIQLFFFAFAVAAASMMCAGMTAGRLDNSETYVGLSEVASEFLATYTTLLDTVPSGVQVTVVNARQHSALTDVVAPDRE